MSSTVTWIAVAMDPHRLPLQTKCGVPFENWTAPIWMANASGSEKKTLKDVHGLRLAPVRDLRLDVRVVDAPRLVRVRDLHVATTTEAVAVIARGLVPVKTFVRVFVTRAVKVKFASSFDFGDSVSCQWRTVFHYVICAIFFY
ncbi:hypothetical protein, variant 2 [Phytophthora nicotianae]|uniref:Uncharacterized protein n=1 Tax=Phytophthora nicotianae TaxID=4792 RepID=W2MRW3_PHYNI|nr:hypothetical protein L914_14707 [Phytophthora nicotianae]ETM39100.1 hypothetical protein, variant 1 [Phytophthora nicotianae]ETM39101.1 hypothetical protein, variant 2 [Phytophthora nicotianae]